MNGIMTCSISTTKNLLEQTFDDGVITGLKLALQEIENNISVLEDSKNNVKIMIKRIENERRKALGNKEGANDTGRLDQG